MRRVLIVDDEKHIQEALRSILAQKKTDYHVIGVFSDCENLKENINRLMPDIVLMDIRMNNDDTSGLRGLRLIKENFPKVKVLMITIEEDNKKIMKAVKNQADGYMLKSELGSTLFKAIDIIFDGGLYMNGKVTRKMGEEIAKNEAKKRLLLNGLTNAEQHIVESVMDGHLEYKEVAKDLNKSVETVKTQFRGIFRKLGIQSKIELVFAIFKGKQKI
ncbi:MAG: response regulator transcription factor [Saprospiraceae bacterium]|nr:response regulator transcription factor [Saprospiraceae bacterium]